MSIVKYSTSNVANTIRANNVAVGINNVNYGPTDTTGFYSGINVPSGGYVIYRFPSGAGQPNVYVAQNDTELINLAGRRNATTITEAISHINGLSNTIIINRNYENIVTDGLILCLDAGTLMSYLRSGTTWRDISGNGNNGSLTNGPTFNGDNGGSIVFDGVNDYVSTPLNIDTNPNTIFAWFKASSVSGARGVVLTDNGNWDKGFEINNGVFSVHTGSNMSSTGVSALANIWYHGAIVYSSTTMNFYINGISIWNSGTPGSTLGSTVEIGRANYPNGSGSRFFVGNISQVQIYNRALSAQEIQQNYNATKARYGL
jgi:hypothetical protein